MSGLDSQLPRQWSPLNSAIDGRLSIERPGSTVSRPAMVDVDVPMRSPSSAWVRLARPLARITRVANENFCFRAA